MTVPPPPPAPGKIVLGYIRTEAEQAVENKPLNIVLLRSCLQIPTPAPAPTSLDGGQDKMLSILLRCSLPYCVETASLTEPEVFSFS